jgi:D-ornithine 4,5-aminomutase subunit alpha
VSFKREDVYEEKRGHLRDLTDEELKNRFWELADVIVSPLIELARTHTSPSIERSVLLRMGFNSIDAKSIVEKANEAELLGKGAGHIVLKVAEKEKISIKEAGINIGKGNYDRECLKGLFGGEA